MSTNFDLGLMALLGIRYVAGVILSFVSIWWGEELVNYIAKNREWGGEISWLIFGIIILTLGMGLVIFHRAILDYCIEVNEIWCTGINKNYTVALLSAWSLICAGGLLMLWPVLKPNHVRRIVILLLLAVSIGGGLFTYFGGFDFDYTIG